MNIFVTNYDKILGVSRATLEGTFQNLFVTNCSVVYDCLDINKYETDIPNSLDDFCNYLEYFWEDMFTEGVDILSNVLKKYL